MKRYTNCFVEESYAMFGNDEIYVKKRNGKAYRRYMDFKHKDKRMRIIELHKFCYNMGYIDWGWKDDQWQQTGKYIKYPKNSNRQKFYKRYSNKVIRRVKNGLHGNQYRKYFYYKRGVY